MLAGSEIFNGLDFLIINEPNVNQYLSYKVETIV